MKKSLLTILLGTAVLAGCNPDNEIGPLVPSAPGVYVLSEGQFGKGDGTVSAYGVASKTLLIDAFGSVNKSAALGDVVQDMGVVGGNRGYICVNASNKVEVVNGPYTNYAPGKVLVLDLTNNTVIDSITVGRCPEQLTVLNGNIYVPNSYDNTVSVIDAASNKVTSTVTVTGGPQTVVADQANNLWVLCSQPYGSTGTPAASLVRFAPGSTAAQLTLPFTSSPSDLRISPDKTQLYYSYNGAEYRMSTTATTAPTTPFIQRDFNGFAIDPRDNSIYGAVSTGYTSNGYFLHYPAGGGKALDSVTVRVGPNGFAFY
jgi:YVTN family beta-propeller protein